VVKNPNIPGWAKFGEMLPRHLSSDVSLDKWQVPLIVPKGVCLMLSEPGCGKTWITTAIGLAVSDAVHLGGVVPAVCPGIIDPEFYGIDPQFVVGHYSREDDPADLKERNEILAKGKEIQNYYVATNCHDLKLTPGVERVKLEVTVKKFRPALLVFDTARRFIEGDENDSEVVSSMMEFLHKLYAKYGTSSLLNHHLRKGSDSPRGSGDFSGAAHYVGVMRKTELTGCSVAAEIETVKTKAVLAPPTWAFGITDAVPREMLITWWSDDIARVNGLRRQMGERPIHVTSREQLGGRR